MKPDAKTQANPSAAYTRDLVLSLPLTRVQVCQKIGIDDRTLRRYMADEVGTPYPIQFALECLVLEP